MAFATSAPRTCGASSGAHPAAAASVWGIRQSGIDYRNDVRRCIELEPRLAHRIHLSVSHCLTDVGEGHTRGVHTLFVAIPNEYGVSPYLASTQVLIERLPYITFTVRRRQFLPDLKSGLELPINAEGFGVRKEERCTKRGSGFAPFVPPTVV